MTTRYDDALIALYRAPLDQFVAERKRLASELKSGGDKAGATRLAAHARPPVSAWAVNQLYWQSREAFDELFAAGARLRAGDLAGTSAHRDAIAKLRALAEKVLATSGQASTEAILRRVVTDLSALAAAGSFDPDPPGALAADREPPGFDAIGAGAFDAAARSEAAHAIVDQGTPSVAKQEKLQRDTKQENEAHAARAQEERERRELARQERERVEQERRKAEEEQAKRRAERERLVAALHRAKADLQTRTQQVDRLRTELADAERTVAKTRDAIADLESRLTALH